MVGTYVNVLAIILILCSINGLIAWVFKVAITIRCMSFFTLKKFGILLYQSWLKN